MASRDRGTLLENRPAYRDPARTPVGNVDPPFISIADWLLFQVQLQPDRQHQRRLSRVWDGDLESMRRSLVKQSFDELFLCRRLAEMFPAGI